MRPHFRIILFNGPPGVGKDSLALYAQSLNGGSRHIKFVSKLKEAVATLFNYPIECMEENKDDPDYNKWGRTIRQHQIALGEAIKTVYGHDFFGYLVADRIQQMSRQTPYVVISDLGFETDLIPLVFTFGKECLTVVRLHQEGRTFEGDSREYVNGDALGVKCYDLDNPHGNREYAKLFIKSLIDGITSA